MHFYFSDIYLYYGNGDYCEETQVNRMTVIKLR